jgi:hypothetical protein
MFAVWFVARGAERIDPAVRDTGPVFRMMITPGSAALWPYLLYLVIVRRRE